MFSLRWVAAARAVHVDMQDLAWQHVIRLPKYDFLHSNLGEVAALEILLLVMASCLRPAFCYGVLLVYNITFPNPAFDSANSSSQAPTSPTQGYAGLRST